MSGNKIISKGVSSTFFNIDILTSLEWLQFIAHAVAYYWLVVNLLFLYCVRDFCEIFIFTISKLIKRVIWILEVAGIDKILEQSNQHVSDRGTQANLGVRSPTELHVSLMTVNEKTASFVENKPQSNSSSESSVCSEEILSVKLNATPKQDLNVVDKVAILTVNDFEDSSINSTLQHTHSPLCTIHLTPCSTRAKYSKISVDSISPEDFSFLKRKWNSLKMSRKTSHVNLQPLFPRKLENIIEERRPKLRMMNCDVKKSAVETESPELTGCYKNFFLKLKSKFAQRNETSVSYNKL